jgi:hypothetical protein
VNRCVKPRNREAVLKPGGYGPVCSARGPWPWAGSSTPKPFSSVDHPQDDPATDRLTQRGAGMTQGMTQPHSTYAGGCGVVVVNAVRLHRAPAGLDRARAY